MLGFMLQPNLRGDRDLLVAETLHTYDPFNRLVGINHQRTNGSSINNYTFGYDAADRITAITDIDGTATYSYDRSNELTGADRPGTSGDEAYTYDANGNRTNAGYQTGANNRLQTDGVYTYSYDDEGNLKTRTTIATGAVRDYTWDYRNRLTGVVDRTGSNTTRQSTYTYDVTNQRIAKTVDLDGAGTAPLPPPALFMTVTTSPWNSLALRLHPVLVISMAPMWIKCWRKNRVTPPLGYSLTKLAQLATW
jgi:YD repeat-containing protein